MRAVIQRVSRAEVAVDAEVVGAIGLGLVALLGVAKGDDERAAKTMARKICEMRIFPDDDGKMNRSVTDARGGVLVISQFTLLADTSRGRRPSFAQAADPETAAGLLDEVIKEIRASGVRVEQGRFRTHMEVSLTNDGPVTISVET